MLFLDVLYVVGQAGTGWGGTVLASLGLWVEAPSRVLGPGGAFGLLMAYFFPVWRDPVRGRAMEDPEECGHYELGPAEVTVKVPGAL